MQPARPYLVVAGPTAVGKSEVALEVAERLDGEIVIADSRQVYRRLDVGTAKPSPEERRRVVHHLIDRVDPGGRYTAADYALDARRAISDIQDRGRTAVVAGGTGFYLEALATGLDRVDVNVDPEARATARAKLSEIPVERRHARLGEVDPAGATRLHPNDRQRVDRALEAWFMTGAPLSRAWTSGNVPLPHVGFRLTRPKSDVRDRIEARFARMLAAGLEAEARELYDEGFAPMDPGIDTIGYQEWWPTFQGRRPRAATCRAIVAATRRYAKRQETWFRNRGDYRPLPAEGAAVAIVAAWGEIGP